VTNPFGKDIARRLIHKDVSIAPLVTFRILFGMIMLISIVRFALKGWIHDFYIQPEYHFTFFGFDWIQPLPGPWMYFLFFLMGLTALFITIGLFYRIATVSFFMLFTYVELIDKTYYLNHYYFISIISFLLIWVPANAYFSVDSRLNPAISTKRVPAWTINIFKLQLGIVYFYAGLAKINPDWLLEAMPLKIWLPAKAYFPIIGEMFKDLWVAYAFSWLGMLYDLSIPFLLLKRKTRVPAYQAVVFFHIMTWLLFPIGMFPLIMIGLTLIFFSEKNHEKVLDHIQKWLGLNVVSEVAEVRKNANYHWVTYFLIIHFAVQILLPFRHALYPGELFWTEQGYRFSWRVMLMEKAGSCDFYIRPENTNELVQVNNLDHLTELQERMMATQPDMILQFAHYLKERYQANEVYTESLVTLQGNRSKPFIDPEINLAQVDRSLKHKNWILPFEKAQ